MLEKKPFKRQTINKIIKKDLRVEVCTLYNNTHTIQIVYNSAPNSLDMHGEQASKWEWSNIVNKLEIEGF